MEPYVRIGEDGVLNPEERTFCSKSTGRKSISRERGLSQFSFKDDDRMNATGNGTAKNIQEAENG
jgi:hypothetical protein